MQFCAGSRTLTITIQLYIFCIALRVTRKYVFPVVILFTLSAFFTVCAGFGLLLTLVTSLCPNKASSPRSFFHAFYVFVFIIQCVSLFSVVVVLCIRLIYSVSFGAFYRYVFKWLFNVFCSGFVAGSNNL